MSTTVRFEHNGIPLEVTGEVTITNSLYACYQEPPTVEHVSVIFLGGGAEVQPNAVEGLAEACDVALADEYKRGDV